MLTGQAGLGRPCGSRSARENSSVAGNWGQGPRSSLSVPVPPAAPVPWRWPSAGHLLPGPAPATLLVSSLQLGSLQSRQPQLGPRHRSTRLPVLFGVMPHCSQCPLLPSSPPGCLASLSPATVILGPNRSSLQAFARAMPAGSRPQSAVAGSFLTVPKERL